MVKKSIKSPDSKMKLPDCTAGELNAALARESRPHVRARLRVLLLVLEGVAPRNAGVVVGCDPATARRWVSKAARLGWRALAVDGRSNPRPGRRKRTTAARAAMPKPPRAPRVPSVTANAGALRAQAAREQDRRMAKRLRVIALLAEGFGTMDAAARERTNETTVRNWRAVFQAGGIDALRRLTPGPRLAPDQLVELAQMLKATPVISLDLLCVEVKERFGVSYTTGGLNNLIQSRFPTLPRTT